MKFINDGRTRAVRELVLVIKKRAYFKVVGQNNFEWELMYIFVKKILQFLLQIEDQNKAGKYNGQVYRPRWQDYYK